MQINEEKLQLKGKLQKKSKSAIKNIKTANKNNESTIKMVKTANKNNKIEKSI